MWEVLTPLVVAESSSDGPAHPHLSVQHILQVQLPDGDGLSAQLVADLLVVHRDGPGDDQDVLEKKHVELLQSEKNRQRGVFFEFLFFVFFK